MSTNFFSWLSNGQSCYALDKGTHDGAIKGWITRRAGSPVTNEERTRMRETVREWISEENLSWARGKTRSEIFARFGNDLKAISHVDPFYLKFLKPGLKNPRVYSGKGYFIDHAVNHHPELSPDEYDSMQDIIDNPDEVRVDDRDNSRRSVVFVKDVGKFGAVVVGLNLSDSDMIVFHKTFFKKKKSAPYQKLKSIKK